MEWRRRNRNTFARGLGGKSRGRRYTDSLPKTVDKVLDGVIAYYQMKIRVASGGANELILEEHRKRMYDAIARLEEE